MTAFERLTQLLDLFRLPDESRRKIGGGRKIGQQVAAVAMRDSEAGREILLVTSRDRGRWIVPKGWIESGEDGGEAAAREAWEEAGISGRLTSSRPIGSYRYVKERNRRRDVECDVDVYLIEDVSEQAKWPEMKQRKRRWAPVAEALELIDEPGLKDVLGSIAQSST